MGVLYKLQFSSGKAYIGITRTDLAQRVDGHRKSVRGGSSCAVHNAWRKYGEPEAIVLAIIEDRELFSTEIRAIAAYRTLAPHGYNCTPGGDGAPSCHPDVAAKISAAMKGKTKSAEHRRKLAIAQTGMKDKPETTIRRSLSHIGKKPTAETSEKERKRCVAFGPRRRRKTRYGN